MSVSHKIDLVFSRLYFAVLMYRFPKYALHGIATAAAYVLMRIFDDSSPSSEVQFKLHLLFRTVGFWWARRCLVGRAARGIHIVAVTLTFWAVHLLALQALRPKIQDTDTVAAEEQKCDRQRQSMWPRLPAPAASQKKRAF